MSDIKRCYVDHKNFYEYSTEMSFGQKRLTANI